MRRITTGIVRRCPAQLNTLRRVQVIVSMSLKDSGVLDYLALLQASRRLDSAQTTQKVRVGLLADAATQRLVSLLRSLFHEHGVDVEIYEGPFDAIEIEVYNANSGLYE